MSGRYDPLSFFGGDEHITAPIRDPFVPSAVAVDPAAPLLFSELCADHRPEVILVTVSSLYPAFSGGFLLRSDLKLRHGRLVGIKLRCLSSQLCGVFLLRLLQLCKISLHIGNVLFHRGEPGIRGKDGVSDICDVYTEIVTGPAERGFWADGTDRAATLKNLFSRKADATCDTHARAASAAYFGEARPSGAHIF